jgi:hypothetical protein
MQGVQSRFSAQGTSNGNTEVDEVRHGEVIHDVDQ